MTTLLSNKAQPGVEPKYLPSGAIDVVATYTFATAPSAGDLVQLMKIPAGATITGVTLDSDKIDTNASATLKFDVGDGTTAQKFIAASTIGQTGGVAYAGVAGTVGTSYTSDTWLYAKVNAAAATFASGTVRVCVEYTIDP